MTQDVLDLRAVVVDILVTSGDTWSVEVTFPGDLTAAVIEGQLRPTWEGTPVTLLDVSTPMVSDGVTTFMYGQDAATTPGVYAIRITPNGGLPRTYIKGRLQLDPNAVHP